MLNNEKILNSKCVKRLFNTKRPTTITHSYKGAILHFFNYVNEFPDDYFNDEYEFLDKKEKMLLSKKYKRDIEGYKTMYSNSENKFGSENKSGSIRTNLSIIKSLFTYNDIDLPTGFWKRTNSFKNSTSSIRETPTHEQLRKILDNTDIQGKCFFGIMKDSGSRISSVINLKRKDIDLNREYPIINFYYKHVKNGITKKKRVTPETKHFLESYFEKMNFKPDDYIFPNPKDYSKHMHINNAKYKWNCALNKTKFNGQDENTNRFFMTSHCLKRFFKTNTYNIDDGLSKYFTEHGSLNDRYIDMDNNKLDKEYAKLVNNLLVYERPYDSDVRIKEVNEELNELKKINEDKDKQINQLEQHVQKLENQIGTIEVFSNLLGNSISRDSFNRLRTLINDELDKREENKSG